MRLSLWRPEGDGVKGSAARVKVESASQNLCFRTSQKEIIQIKCTLREVGLGKLVVTGDVRLFQITALGFKGW